MSNRVNVLSTCRVISTAIVTRAVAVWGRKPQGTQVETHFIEKVTGKYLGESDEYYKLGKGDKIVTFPGQLHLNVRAIPKEDWAAKDFGNISEPLQFDGEKIKQDFVEIVNRNKNAKPIDRTGMFPKDPNVEHSLVIIHDFKELTLTSVILPSGDNSNKESSSFKYLIVRTQDGSWLVPPKHWEAAKIAYETKNSAEKARLYGDARDATLIVIGFSHTHPDVVDVRKISESFNAVKHSATDLRIAQETGLPDIIITVSVSITNYDNKSIVKLELLTKRDLKVGDVKELPSFEEFLNQIERSIFEYIIKEYRD